MFDSFKASKRLTEQEEAMSRVERRVTALEIQWADTLDRLKTMMGRLLKERQRTERAAAEMEETPHVSDEEVAAGNTWTPKQIEAQQRILARRNRMGGREQ
jgi:uncharacterized coiled-coil protein SlyX